MPPSVPDKIPCHTAKDLRYALDPLRALIEQPETEENWDKISRALQTIAALTRGGAAELDSEYVKEIRTFSSLILNSMNSERTRLANIAVDLFTVIAPPLGSGFEPLIGVFVPTLIRLLGRTNKVFVSRATAGLRAIISNCPHPRILVELRCMATDKSASLRVLVATAVLQCMNEWDWSVPSLAAKAGDVETVIRALGTDSNVDARKVARQIFDLYKQIFPDRVDSFLEPLTPVIKRYLDIKSKASHDSGPTSRKPAPVPAPKFKAAAVPAPAPPPVQQVVEQPQEEPARPKMTRVGLSRAGPSRAPVGASHAPPAPIHSRVVSGPERITTHLAREHGTESAVSSGPMRAALPSGVHAGPVARSVSASGPSRMRVEAPAPYSAAPSVTDSQSSYPGPPPEPTRRFRPARAPMDPSQMPQRVAIQPPAPKPTVEPRKIDGPSRVNVGAGTRSVSGPVVVPPTRVVSTSARAEHELKTSMTAPVLPASTNEPQIQSAPVSVSSSTSGPVQTVTIPEPSAIGASIPSPASVPIPASAPTSRPASAIPPDSRPGSAMSIATSRAQPIGASTSTETPATAAPPKPTLTSSKSAPITTKVSALIKRGNPYAPPPFVPKRAPASGGVGAGTASQMARQREAIAAREAREKKESEEAAKKAKREAGQKKEATKANEAKETNRKEKEKASSRPRPASSQASSSRNAPAAPRKQAALSRMKPPGGPPKVDIKDIEPEMVAAVCAPLPGSPTPPEVRAVPLPPSPTANNAESTEPVEVEVEEMAVDDAVEADAPMEPVVQEPTVEETTPVESQEPAVPATGTDEAAPVAKPTREVIEISDDEDMDESEQANTGMVEVEASTIAEPTAQTPQRAVQVSLIDQTPAPMGTTPAAPPTGFAFHPQLAHLMALAPQPVQEAEDFLVDLSSPPPKERSVDKEAPNRPALGDRGNTHTYLSQFTQDLMTLSGL